MTSTQPRARRDGTGPEWATPASEAHRILGERIEAGVDTWADNALAALFHTLAATDPAKLRAALDDLQVVTSGWSTDLKTRLDTVEGHAVTFSPWVGSLNTATGLPLTDWECSCGMSDHGFLTEDEARSDWEVHARG